MEKHDHQTLLSKDEIEAVYGVISRLQDLRYIEPITVTSTMMIASNNNNSLLRQIIDLEQKLETIAIAENFKDDTVITIRNITNNILNFANSVKRVKDEINRLEQNRLILEEQITQASHIVDDPAEKLVIIKSEMAQLEDKVEKHEIVIKAYDIHEMLSLKREKVVEVNNKMVDMGYLRQHAKNLECQQLQATVDCINQSVQSVCESLYDSPLNISLQLFKTIKSTKDIKPIVNFTITNKGATYDNVDDISGGEGDRASLAITLALKRLSSCPFIMLDECVVSVDTNIIETTIKTIRQNTSDTVLLTFPDFIEGLFDHVINVEEYV